MLCYALYPLPAITGAAIEVPAFDTVEQLDTLLTECIKSELE